MNKDRLHATHTATVIELDALKEFRELLGKNYKPAYQRAMKQLKEYLSKGLASPLQTCPNCGSLLPELRITYRNKHYQFTCTQIVDEHRKEIVETDLDKLGIYCLNHGFKTGKSLREMLREAGWNEDGKTETKRVESHE